MKKHKPTFLFYDIETSGLNKSFDQVLQFAAIKTDLELNELERHEILVRLAPDVVPSPYAILTNQISISQLQQQGQSEIDAIIKIHKLMNTAGTISIGYNTLGFDDEFLRFSFYRNLLPPYTHQFANGCSRADLYPILVCYFLYKNEILQWPKINNKITFKLEHLNAANQLADGVAHTAIADVEMTIALAKRCYKEKSMWDYLLNFFSKETAQARITKLNNAFADGSHYREGVLIDGIFGHDNSFFCPVLFLGQHLHYKNKTVWLRLDSEELTAVTEENIAEKTWGMMRKPGENSIWLPFTDNYAQHLSETRRALVVKNKAWLKNNAILNTISDYYRNYTYPKIPNLDIDAALYETGFLSNSELLLCQAFHAALPEKKPEMLVQFTNPALLELAIRILGRHYPTYLPEKYLENFEDHLQRVKVATKENSMLNYKGDPRLNPKQALHDIAMLREQGLTEKQLGLLDDLETYLQDTFALSVA